MRLKLVVIILCVCVVACQKKSQPAKKTIIDNRVVRMGSLVKTILSKDNVSILTMPDSAFISNDSFTIKLSAGYMSTLKYFLFSDDFYELESDDVLGVRPSVTYTFYKDRQSFKLQVFNKEKIISFVQKKRVNLKLSDFVFFERLLNIK